MVTRHVVMLGFDDAQLLDIAGPLEVFSRASRLLTEEGRLRPPAYTVELVGMRPGRVRTSSGVELVAPRGFSSVEKGVDTLLVAGGRGVPRVAREPALKAWLRRMAGRARRVGSVCTGSFLLAEAGLLDGRRATTHWEWSAKLAAAHPKVRVDADALFLREGKIYTSAGVTAGMDLALGLVEEDHGPRIARATARQLVLFLQRPGGQSQFSAQLQTQLDDRAPLAELATWMADHLRADLSVDALARRVAMSPRNFARVFTRTVGQTPAKYVERLRVDAAKRRLVESRAGVAAVADDCGFGTTESMRRAFRRTLRVSPDDYRSRFGARAVR